MSDELFTPRGTGAPGSAPGEPAPGFLQSIRFKLGATLAGCLVAVAVVLAAVINARTRAEYLEHAIAQNQQLAEVIRRSTRFAMLQNNREQVARIIEAVSRMHGIEKIRILSRDGVIITSTKPDEVGSRVDKTAEACVQCHRAGEPLAHLPGKERHRTFTSPAGHRVLGTIDVIRNEPACSTAACHSHPESTTVLGVLDIAYSLDEMDTRQRADLLAVAGISAALALVTFLLVGLAVQRLVYRPLADLEAGARLVSSGDRDHLIPVRHADEIGHLSASFNRMTQDLKRYEHDLEQWARTLERKVEEKSSALRLAEAKALNADKLASVGLLAAGIAHEINNPLTGVLTFAHLVRQKLPAGSPEAEDLDIIIRETKRCAAIIRRLLDFAREKKPEMTTGDLNQVIRETVELLEHQAGFQGVAFTLALDPSVPPLWMDPNQFKQVFMNLVMNARDAMEGSGSITASTRVLPGLVAPATGRRAVPCVEAAVADTGCGIAPGDLAKIFDPFYTSKAPGKGVGLGLSVSYSIVRAHGGRIEVESEVGRGTTFRIILPIEAEPQPAAGA